MLIDTGTKGMAKARYFNEQEQRESQSLRPDENRGRIGLIWSEMTHVLENLVNCPDEQGRRVSNLAAFMIELGMMSP